MQGGRRHGGSARALLVKGTYPVNGGMDMWAFGQMLLDITRSLMPSAQREITEHEEFRKELVSGVGDPRDTRWPWQGKHLQYLADLVTPGFVKTAYSDQVTTPYMHAAAVPVHSVCRTIC